MAGWRCRNNTDDATQCYANITLSNYYKNEILDLKLFQEHANILNSVISHLQYR